MEWMFLLNSDIFLWDFAILLLLCLSGGFMIGTGVLAKRKHSVLLSILCFLCLLCFLSLVYASFLEPHIITVTRAQLSTSAAPPVKIAIVSDIHVGPYKGEKFVEKAVQKINAQLPDLVLMAGDFILTHDADLSDLDPLQNISAPLGVYAVLGNHDVGQYMTFDGKRYTSKNRGDAIAAKLDSLGVVVLRNSYELQQTTEGALAIAGVDDIWTGHADLEAALQGIPASAYIILLSHNPSIVDDPLSRKADLIVSGHTHGGQIRLPFLGPLATLPTSLGQKYDQGLFEMDTDTVLAITRGLGESSARMRFLAIPEVMIVETSPLP